MASEPIFPDVPAWPTPKTAPPPMGHNKPPLEEVIPLEFREELLSDKPDFLTVLDRYLGVGNPDSEDYVEGAVDRAKAEDDETLGKCGEVVKNLRIAEQHVDRVHKAVKEPYLKGGRLVDAEKNALIGRILAGKDKVQARMNEYAAKKLKEQREEQARQEEVRRKLEALAKENNLEDALPPAPEPVRSGPIRSDGGAAVSLGTEWHSAVEDYAKAFKHVKNDAKVREAIDAAIQRHVKATKGNNGKPLAGVRMWEAARTTAR